MTTESARRQWLRQMVGLAGAATWGSAARVHAAPAAAQGKAPAAWPEWDQFKKHFITDTGRVVDRSNGKSQTFSEGQSYGLFFALVANDRPMFDQLLRWTEDNLCGGDLTARLPAWLWGRREDDTWGVMDANAASDSDLWIAYALGEAGRLWNDRRYRALSSLLSARVLREETATLPGLGPVLLPGPRGFVLGGGRWKLNPSYMPPQLMRWLAKSEPQPAWGAVAESSQKIILGASPKGFTADWILYDEKQGFLPDLEGDEKGQGTYNAIRVYLWAGMLHSAAPYRQELLTALAPMAHYVRDQGYPPESIDILTGQAAQPGPVGFSACLLPFLAAQGDSATLQAQQLRLEARPLRPDAYYDTVLALFGLGWMQQRYRFTADGQLQTVWGR